jgi:hypothetical protein
LGLSAGGGEVYCARQPGVKAMNECGGRSRRVANPQPLFAEEALDISLAWNWYLHREPGDEGDWSPRVRNGRQEGQAWLAR